MIDKRELSAKARERNLSLNIIEKDYVLGWLLFGLSTIDSLVFKGGTALSKIYFPEIWRLSEDLDFSLLEDDFSIVTEKIPEILTSLEKKSKIKLTLGNQFFNPGYLQLKIKYEAVIGKNWIKVDVTKNDLVAKPPLKKIGISFSDYPIFKIRVESVEEIFCAKLRTLIERKKSRDYFDLWKLTKLSLDFNKVREILPKKLDIKSIQLNSLDQIFPDGLSEILLPYWERELGRLVFPLPDFNLVQKELKEFINGKFFHHP